MGSTNFTTHYSIPLPLGTDLTTPMDYNESMEAIDTAIWSAETDAENASDAAASAVSTANAASDAVDTLSADLVQEKSKIIALQTRMTNAENEIDDVRADSEDAICAYNEPTATSTHAYSAGEYFFYNNTLYQATASIAIGATIVPDTNCETATITNKLIQINTALKHHHKTTVTNETYKNVFDSLYSILAGLDSEHYGSSEIVYYDGTARRHFYFNYVSTGQFVFTNVLSSSTNVQVFEISVKNGSSSYKQGIVSADSFTENDFSSSTFTGYVDLIY